jgi:predicted PurR-regulated permease PerM
MEESISKLLLTYGPLGVMTLLSLLVAQFLYKEKRRWEDQCHQWEERYITKVEKLLEQYNALVHRVDNIVEVLTKRLGPKG